MPANNLNYKNFGVKALSLLFAITLWFYLNHLLEKNSGGPAAYKDIKAIEVKLMGEPSFLGKNLFLVEMENKIVDLRVKGPQQEIERLTRSDITAYVDLSNLNPGKTYSPVVKFILPEGIEMVGASPVLRVEIKDRTL